MLEGLWKDITRRWQDIWLAPLVFEFTCKVFGVWLLASSTEVGCSFRVPGARKRQTYGLACMHIRLDCCCSLIGHFCPLRLDRLRALPAFPSRCTKHAGS